MQLRYCIAHMRLTPAGGSGTTAILVGALLTCVPLPALGQQHVALRGDILFYGDNTEFSNPFSEGETIFGAAVRLAGVIDLNTRTSVTIGVFGNQRFGSGRCVRTGPARDFVDRAWRAVGLRFRDAAAASRGCAGRSRSRRSTRPASTVSARDAVLRLTLRSRPCVDVRGRHRPPAVLARLAASQHARAPRALRWRCERVDSRSRCRLGSSSAALGP